jgi:hypothetical protein
MRPFTGINGADGDDAVKMGKTVEKKPTTWMYASSGC